MPGWRVASNDRICLLAGGLWVLLSVFLCSCAPQDQDHRIVVSVADQALDLYYGDRRLARYQVSTSRFGLGDRPGSCWTPLGRMKVAQKVGDGAPVGMVFRDRRPTGEILRPNAPGRDPIVTRILWLKGLDPQNRNAYRRCIYIHGTPVEKDLGRPASYGCIRMRSQDILQLFATVGVGARVEVTTKHLPNQPNTLVQQAAGGGGAPIRE